MTNKVDYFEVGSADPEASKAFYGGLFEWTFGGGASPTYSAINGTEGGLWDTTETGGGHYAIFYVHVDDVQASLDRAVSLGATALFPLVDNGQIQFAHLVDPQGNRFAVWKPNSENSSD